MVIYSWFTQKIWWVSIVLYVYQRGNWNCTSYLKQGCKEIETRLRVFISRDWTEADLYPAHGKIVVSNHLVGGIPTPLKNMSSSVGMIIPNIWKNMFQTTNQLWLTNDSFQK